MTISPFQRQTKKTAAPKPAKPAPPPAQTLGELNAILSHALIDFAAQLGMPPKHLATGLANVLVAASDASEFTRIGREHIAKAHEAGAFDGHLDQLDALAAWWLDRRGLLAGEAAPPAPADPVPPAPPAADPAFPMPGPDLGTVP